MVLICISLMSDHVDLLFIYLLAICILSLEKCLFKSFAHVLIKLLDLLLLRSSSLYRSGLLALIK